ALPRLHGAVSLPGLVPHHGGRRDGVRTPRGMCGRAAGVGRAAALRRAPLRVAAKRLPMSEIAVRVSGLTYAYPNGPTALDGVSLELAAGERAGLVGPNGAGKTTLFFCPSGALPAPRGRIALLGLDPADPAQRRRLPEHVGIVFQNSDDQLFNTTVLDDVAFGPLNLGLPPE